MSNIAIDQLFQVTTPALSGRESLRTTQPEGDPFRAHLSRAEVAAEPKSRPEKATSETATLEAKETPKTPSGEQETSTDEQDQSTVEIESSESTAEVQEEPPLDEEPTDQIELSAAAAQAVIENSEIVIAAEQAANLEEVAETSSSDDQQQSSDQSAKPTAATIQETNEAIANSANLEGVLSGGAVEGETGNEVGLTSEVTEAVTTSLETTVETAVPQASNAGPTQEGTTILQPSTASKSSNEQQTGNGHGAEEALLEADATEESQPANSGRFEVPSTTTTPTNDATAAPEVELALDDSISVPKPAAGSPTTTNSSNVTDAAIGRTTANQLTSKTGNQADSAANTPSSETSTADRARFVHRVSGAIRSAQQRDGQIRIRLSPPELGTLQIKIVMSEGALTAHLETETTAARAVLLDNLPMLRERLAEQEIHIEKFDVDVGREGQQQADDSETEERESNRASTPHDRPSKQDRATRQVSTESSADLGATTNGLDVRI